MEAPKSRFSLAGKLALVVTLDVAVVAAVGAFASSFGFPPLSVFLAALGVGLPLAVWSLGRAWNPIRRTLAALADGVGSFQENDFSLRLASDRRDELGDLVSLYNRMGDALRIGHNDIFQRELLLDTLLQGAPMAILMVNPLDRIAYANVAARHLLGGGARLQGRSFAEVIASAPDGAREPLSAGRDAVFTWAGAGGGESPEGRSGADEETYRVLQRRFQLHTQENRLVVIERITPELRRQEVEVWKKAIRVLSHELNNSLAPVSSLLHSARHVAGNPSEAGRLDGIFDAIDERVRHLSDFLEGYGRFARLPRPVKTLVPWSDLLDPVERLFPFRRIGDFPREAALVDSAQMQQVLINLLKNAAESGSPPDEIAVSVRPEPGRGWRLEILDRGSGMDDDTMKRALLPFYSSKPTGSGLGLALCSEIVHAHGGTLRLERRAGGGTAVICLVPLA